VSFGPSTSDGVLVAYRYVKEFQFQSSFEQSNSSSLYRLGSLDWQFSNVTADATYQFVGDWSELSDEEIREKKIFEMRGKTFFRTEMLAYMLTET
jgi:hypothetical protein